MKALTVSLVVSPLWKVWDVIFFLQDIFEMNTRIHARKGKKKKKFVSSQDSLAPC